MKRLHFVPITIVSHHKLGMWARFGRWLRSLAMRYLP